MEWCPPGLLICLPLVILPSTTKSRRSFLLAPAHPGGARKRAVKWLWYGGGGIPKVLIQTPGQSWSNCGRRRQLKQKKLKFVEWFNLSGAGLPRLS